MIRALATSAAAAASVPPLYLLGLTVLSRKPDACVPNTSIRFTIVVPAHDEAGGIAGSIASLQEICYPRHLVRIVVVADNCTDRTADVAAAQGVTVLERVDHERHGKGHALAFAFERILADPWTDVIVVVDADTVVSDNLLERLAGHVASGARAVQADYRVRNPGASWRTRLTDVAFTCNHRIRSAGRANIGASAGLRGNGMALSRAALELVPYSAFTVVEDVEFGVDLGRAGIAVDYCSVCFVAGDMPTNAAGARSQRVRWELGRAAIRRRTTTALARDAVRKRSLVLADLAADLTVPPLATIAVRLLAVTSGCYVTRRRTASMPLALGLLGSTALLCHVATGIVHSQSRWKALPAIARAPAYVAWKIVLRASPAWRDQKRSGLHWSRTQRSTNEQSRSVEGQ